MIENSPFFSIIVPTRNRSLLLRRCIESVTAQLFIDWELIIIDDGSQDDTKTLVNGFEDKRIRYSYQKHQERSSARNKGIALAQGKYVCFIDDDDYVNEKYLSDYYEYYKANQFSDVILRTGFVKKIGDKEKYAVNYDKKKHKNPVNYVLYNMCGVGCLCIPGKALLEDKFPIEFPHWQDTHLFVRLLLKYEMIQLPSYNYIYIIHEKMGSKLATLNFDPIERAELNVRAIENVFAKVNKHIYELVPENTLQFLKAEKYLEYANNVRSANKEKSQLLFRKSRQSGVFLKLYKSYISLFINS